MNRSIILLLLLSLPLNAQEVIFKNSFENTPPVIISSPVTAGEAGVLYNYDVDATDFNGDLLAYYFTVSPEGMEIDAVTGEISWTPDKTGDYAVAVEVSDGQYGFASQAWSIGVLPPDPLSVATVNDPTVVTTVFESTKFLYSGDSPIQTGVENGTIDLIRAAVISGKVITRDGSPLPGVTITILNHEEFGQTLSRSDGKFDMVVNGGGLLTVDYTAASSLPAQRQLNVPWQDFIVAPDVALVKLDPIVTTIDMNSGAMQMAEGSMESDGDGERHAMVLFPQGTTAQLVMPDGSLQAISSLDVRATEYTVGPNGPAAMPGELPPTSGYTYAVELSIDEAITAGATDIQFNQPVYNYVENFIGFPVGTVVPTGYYDRQKGQWIGSDNGLVIEIVSETDGLADVDVDGDGVAEVGQELANLGITDAERQTLGTVYEPGESLWRVPITHFTPWDYNWPWAPPSDAVAPDQSGPSQSQGTNDTKDPCEKKKSSIIECQNQVLREQTAITGTPYSLNYSSSRVHKDSKQVKIPISGPEALPNSLKRIEIDFAIAGQSFKQIYAPAPDLSLTYVWDGKNEYGQEVFGTGLLTGTISYMYDLVYTTRSNFTQAWALAGDTEVELPAINSREIGLRQPFSRRLQSKHPETGLGGWSLDVHMYYDPVARILYRGDGTQLKADRLPDVITTIAGNGDVQFSGDGGPAIDASFSGPRGLVSDAEGNLFIIDPWDKRIRKIDTDGVISTIGGTGAEGCDGDGAPALNASFTFPEFLAIGPDGSLYVSDEGCLSIRKINPDGIIETVAGGGPGPGIGDEGLATEAVLERPRGIVVSKSGSLYIADRGQNRVRRVGPGGLITTVAGNGTAGFSGDGSPAVDANLNLPMGLAMGLDGTLYIADNANCLVRAVTPDGIINTFAGNFVCDQTGDGGPATEASLFRPWSVAVDADNILYSLSTIDLRKVTPDGIITTIAGSTVPGQHDQEVEGGPAADAKFNFATGLAVGPDKNLYISDSNSSRIRRISPLLPGLSIGDIVIPSEDGAVVYRFDSHGRHLQTISTLTSTVLFEFDYDINGLLIAVTDADGNVTSFERSRSGSPEAIVGPFGQRTVLELNQDGYLTTITNPASEGITLEYTTDGLLTKMTNPLGQFSQYSYDDLGRLILAEDAAGGSQAFIQTELDDGFLITRTTAMGRVSTYAVQQNSTNNIELLSTDPVGAQTRVQQKVNGDLIYAYPDGMKLTYKSAGEPRFGTAPFFVTTQELTTPDGLISTSKQSRTVTLADSKNPFSLLTEVTEVNINGRIYKTVIDTTSNTTTRTTPEGRSMVQVFDNKARVTSTSRDSNLDPLITTFDGLGRISILELGNQSITLGYDLLGRLVTSENAAGEQVSFEHDDANRRTALIFPSGRTFRFNYDLVGNLTAVVMPNGAKHDLAYTAINNFSSYTVAGDVNSLVSEYNPDRQKTVTTKPSGGRIENLFDPDTGRDLGISYPAADINFTYVDASDRIETINRTPTDASAAQLLTYQYDGSIMTSARFTGAANGGYTYRYDNNFQLVGRTLDDGPERAFSYDNDLLPTGNGPFSISRTGPDGRPGILSDSVMSITYGFNRETRLVDRTHQVTSAEIYHLDLTFDLAGRITHKTETVKGITIAYDYIYDLDGQLLEVYEDGLLAERYEYDVNGNRTLREISGIGEITTYDATDKILDHGGLSYSFDQDGFLTQRGSATFEYSVRGELLKVIIGPDDEIQYTYDGLGRRVARTDNEGTTQYLYGNAGNQLLVTEVRAPNATLSHYFYDETGILVAMERAGTRYYIASDQVGSPRVVTDASGVVVKRIVYDSWGVQIEDSNPAFDLPFGFAGGMGDGATGLVHFGLRDYDPRVGRWMARDPILYQGGQANLFAYSGNDPVNFRDPTGLSCIGFEGFIRAGGGISFCRKNGEWSLCGQIGFGLGGGPKIDVNGPAASASDKLFVESSAGLSCGPFSFGIGLKIDSCLDVTVPCSATFFGVGPNGDCSDSSSFKWEKGKAEFDPSIGVLGAFSETVKDMSAKDILVNGKPTCTLSGKLVAGGCLTTKE